MQKSGFHAVSDCHDNIYARRILFITHKLNEIMEVADRCTILRKGKYIDTVDVKDTTPEKLSAMMVGRNISFSVNKAPAKPGDVVLDVKGMTVAGESGKKDAVKNVSFQVRAGEIVCIAGIDGNGQTELVYGLSGLSDLKSGTIHLNGQNLTKASVRDHPASRSAELICEQPVCDYRDPALCGLRDPCVGGLREDKARLRVKSNRTFRQCGKVRGHEGKENMILTMAISGGLAGLGAGFLYLSGIEQWACAQTAVPNMGFNGIAAAFLGGIHPIGAVFSSFFIQHITSGGAYVDKMVYCSQISDLIAAIIIYFCGFVLFFKHCMNQKIQKAEEKKIKTAAKEGEE